MYRHLLTTLLLLSFHTLMYAQLEVTSGDTPPFEPETILENFFFGGGVEVLDITYNGDAAAVGFFDGENSNIGIDRGILITSGDAVNAEGPNTETGTTSSHMLQDEEDLEQLIPGFTIFDPAVYEIQFIPYDTIVRFTYVWASDEYPEFAPPASSLYNDVFGFFLSGPGINGPFTDNAENIAYLPDGVTPVSINNVNAITNQTYYQSNLGGTTVEYDGFTVPLEASSLVVPCDTYNIKIAVADAGDGVFDSGVFLASGSFGTDALNISVNTFAADSTMVEGCVGAAIEFVLGIPAEADFPLDYTIWGTAQNGIDYDPVPLDAFIPAGEDSLTLVFNPIEDGLVEDLEVIYIDVKTNICGRDTFAIYIGDNQLVPPPLDDDATICEGESVSYDATLPIQLPESVTFTNPQSINIPDNDVTNPAFSTIEILGAIPEQVAEGSILSVCIDITHSWDGDLDVYLIAPSGQFLNLTTDNGGSGDNYTQTCFTATAVTPIEGLGTAEAPFTGDYLPESPWEDIYGADMNGVWTLQVSDDSGGFAGTINGWSMTLPPIYTIGYIWEPEEGVSNPNLPNVDLSPTTTTTYTVTAFDTYGCTTKDEVTITVTPSLPAPMITCDNSANGQVTFSWDAVAGATGYEVNVNGAGWVTANGGTSHTISGLSDGQVVTIEVQGLDGGCGTLSATLDCTAVTAGCALASDIDDTQDATCFGGNDGQFTVSATSGTEPYIFTIPGLTSTSGTFIDLEAGTYNVSITDDVGCGTIQIVTINEPDSLQFSVSINTVSCNGGDDASVTFTASGGTADYEYSLDGTNFQTTNIFENLTAGTYPLTVNDANGCEATASLTIQEPPAITLMPSVTSALCNGSADGTATVTPTGGTPSFTYTWDANANNQTTQTATGLAAGTYDVTVEDANGCEATTQVTIDEPDAITLTSSNTAASCNGGADGTATITANNGATPYTYQWDTNASSQNGPTAVGLAFGSYSITVTDANGCEVTDQVDVPELSSLEYTTASTQLDCFGDDNGTATVEVTAGTAPYTYAWNTTPQQSTSTIIGLTSGTYTVTITDGGGCSDISSIDITEPEELTLALTATDPLCAGEDGTITTTVSGGTGTYAYTWSNGAPGANTNAPAGTYNVIVTDTNGCQVTAESTLSDPAPLTFTATPTDALCNGSNDGIINFSASGGIPPYQYSIDGGLTFFSNNIFDNLAAGIYNVLINDGNNCSANAQEITIGEADAITLTSSNTAASCNGGADGSATITANNGTAPYTYLWDSNASNQNGPTAVGLTLGSYAVTVTDANGCEATDQVDVPELSSLEYTSAGTQLNCFGDTDGTATVEVTSGTQPYTYLWNTTPAQSTPTVTNLSGGTYVVTITDGGGCSEVVSIDVVEPTELIVDLLTPTNALCAGENGAISSTVSGGTGTYTYSWNNGMDTPDISTTAGTYTLIVTDANGCTASAESTITEPASVSLTATPTDVLCNGNNDGTITIAASGGTANFTYSLDGVNFQNENIFENLPAGTYTVFVNDDNDCTANEEITISEPDALALTLASTDESCAGSDGTATVTASNGTGDYTYTWSDGQNTPTADALNAGNYTVTVTDANGCEIFESIEVISEVQIQVGLTTTDVSCFGASDGEASIIAEGVEPISYQWNANAGNQTTPTASGLSGGTYAVTITDGNDCSKVEEVMITEPAPISLALTGEDLACNGTATGTASVAAAGGTGSYLYQWNDTNMQQSEQITDLAAGTYTVTVTDANGCQVVDSLLITEPIESVSVTGAGSTLDCFGDTNGTITLEAGGGTPPYSYSLDNENFTQGNIFIGLTGGEYTVYATDATGECTAQGIITVTEPPELTVDAGEDIELMYGDSIVLEAIPSDSIANHTYTWSSYSPDWNLSCTDCPTPWARPLNQIMYTVTIENENGCIATDDVRVFINKEQPVFVANAFTPNGDSFNDVLYVQGGAAAKRVVVFQVFDRWGELIFDNRDTELNNKETGWDGSYRGEEMNPAVFVWYAEVEFVDGSRAPFKGHATLIR